MLYAYWELEQTLKQGQQRLAAGLPEYRRSPQITKYHQITSRPLLSVRHFK